jgi:hypothetical protein
VGMITLLLALGTIFLVSDGGHMRLPHPPAPTPQPKQLQVQQLLLHKGITATVFWIGEPSDMSNGFIPNNVSAWDSQWQRHFGGVDTPGKRQHGGAWPAGFVPHENPFYIALPYNDLGETGVKTTAIRIPWFDPTHPPSQALSILKNHWVAVSYKGKTVYAQWEDVGPGESDDFAYVFGSARPKNTFGQHAGIDLSPAVADYLGIDGVGTVDWSFAVSPPAGPWLQIVTTSQVVN